MLAKCSRTYLTETLNSRLLTVLLLARIKVRPKIVPRHASQALIDRAAPLSKIMVYLTSHLTSFRSTLARWLAEIHKAMPDMAAATTTELVKDVQSMATMYPILSIR